MSTLTDHPPVNFGGRWSTREAADAFLNRIVRTYGRPRDAFDVVFVDGDRPFGVPGGTRGWQPRRLGMVEAEMVPVTISEQQMATGLLPAGDRKDGRPPVTVQQAAQQIIDNYFAQPGSGAGGAIG